MAQHNRRWTCASLMAGAAVLCAGQAKAADWSDTFLGFRYGTAYREPANPDDIAKGIVQLSHVSGYKYGSNFFNVDVLKSDDKDQAHSFLSATDPAINGGAQEIYLVYRHNLNLGKTFAAKDIAFGPIRSLGLTAGFDFNAKNDGFSPRVVKVIVGPTFSFAVPGFLDVSLVYRTERNHNAFVGKSVTFDNAFGVSVAWGIPIKGTPLKFKGFGDFISAKGTDGFGGETKPEILTEPALMLDLGSVLWKKKDKVYVGVSYHFWNNKFGADPATTGDCKCGTRATTPQFQMEAHF